MLSGQGFQETVFNCFPDHATVDRRKNETKNSLSPNSNSPSKFSRNVILPVVSLRCVVMYRYPFTTIINMSMLDFQRNFPVENKSCGNDCRQNMNNTMLIVTYFMFSKLEFNLNYFFQSVLFKCTCSSHYYSRLSVQQIPTETWKQLISHACVCIDVWNGFQIV